MRWALALLLVGCYSNPPTEQPESKTWQKVKLPCPVVQLMPLIAGYAGTDGTYAVCKDGTVYKYPS